MRIWMRKGYIVEERHTGQFDVIGRDGSIIGTIVTATSSDRDHITEWLNKGEGVNGWEDGSGGTIWIEEDA